MPTSNRVLPRVIGKIKKYILLLIIVSFVVDAIAKDEQTTDSEIRAWSNFEGIRMDGQLMERDSLVGFERN